MGIYSSSTSTPKSDKTSKSTQTRVAKKLLKKNVDGKREQARVRQARRRAKIKAGPETYQKEKEKRRKKYQEKKEKAANSVVKIVQRNQKRKGVPKKRCIILQWKGTQKCGTKATPSELIFLKKMFDRDDVNQTNLSRVYYIRKKIKFLRIFMGVC